MTKSKRRPARPSGDLPQARTVLQHYATRGAFRSFAELPARGRTVTSRFNWFRDVPFTITFHPPTRTLTYVDLLPDVPARSPMDRDLRRFVASRESPTLPDHRRVDRRRLDVTIRNRGARVSIAFRLKAAHVEYGVRKSVNLVHEIFTDYLSDARFASYQVDHFRLDPEMARSRAGSAGPPPRPKAASARSRRSSRRKCAASGGRIGRSAGRLAGRPPIITTCDGTRCPPAPG